MSDERDIDAIVAAIEARAADHRPDAEVVAEELARYGIPATAGVEGLLRHIYANRDMALDANRLAIATYKERLAASIRADDPALLALLEAAEAVERAIERQLRLGHAPVWIADERRAISRATAAVRRLIEEGK